MPGLRVRVFFWNSSCGTVYWSRASAGQSDEYLEGIERMIRVCIEEFEPKEKFPSGS